MANAAGNFCSGPAILPYRLIWIAAIPVGALTQLDAVWLLADTLNGLMALPNLISLLLLCPLVLSHTYTYFKKCEHCSRLAHIRIDIQGQRLRRSIAAMTRNSTTIPAPWTPTLTRRTV